MGPWRLKRTDVPKGLQVGQRLSEVGRSDSKPIKPRKQQEEEPWIRTVEAAQTLRCGHGWLLEAKLF